MKNLVLIFLSLTLSWSTGVLAQEAPQIATRVETEKPKTFWNDVNVFLNAFPVPIVSGGVGGAIEYAPFTHASFWWAAEREENQAEGSSPYFDTAKAIYTHQMLGMRFYLEENSGVYASTGYKWGEVDTRMNVLLVDNVSKLEKVSGAYVGAGYRFRFGRAQSKWFLDLGASYEPGYVKSMKYVAKLNLREDQSGGLRATSGSYLETDIGYNLNPEVRMGMNF